MVKADIVIIGGGVVGASIAFHLSERGAGKILILEAEKEQGKGSTGKATGGVRAQFGTEINIRMSLYSLEFFKYCGFDCEYEPRGYLFFTSDEKQLELMRSTVELQRRIGVDVDIIGREDIADLVPGMNCNDIAGGTFAPNDGFINPLAVMRGFTAKALSNGTTINCATRVSAIETVGGKVAGVMTENGRIECGTVVLCTGARSAELALTVGIEMPVEPLRRQIAWVRSAANDAPRGLPMVIDAATGFHFRPARDFEATQTRAKGGEYLIAYPDPAETSSLNCDFDDGFLETVLERALHRAPFLYNSSVVREKCRAGLYENTPDHHAIIGSCDTEGLYFANGFSGHGVMHSPAAGRALSEIILDGESSFLDISCLHIDRFRKGELMHEPTFI